MGRPFIGPLAPVVKGSIRWIIIGLQISPNVRTILKCQTTPTPSLYARPLSPAIPSRDIRSAGRSDGVEPDLCRSDHSSGRSRAGDLARCRRVHHRAAAGRPASAGMADSGKGAAHDRRARWRSDDGAYCNVARAASRSADAKDTAKESAEGLPDRPLKAGSARPARALLGSSILGHGARWRARQRPMGAPASLNAKARIRVRHRSCSATSGDPNPPILI